MKPNQSKKQLEEIPMGDTEANGGGRSPSESVRRAVNVKRARILVLLIPLAVAIIVGGVALANSSNLGNLFSSFEPRVDTGIAQNSATTEAALARDIEREARVLDVIAINIVDGNAFLWIVDLESGTTWSDRDSKAVTRAFDVLFEWAQKNEYGVSIIFFTIQSLMGTEGLPVDVFQGAFQFVCPADLVAEYGRGGQSSDVIMGQCDVVPDGLFISGNAEVPLLGR